MTVKWNLTRKIDGWKNAPKLLPLLLLLLLFCLSMLGMILCFCIFTLVMKMKINTGRQSHALTLTENSADSVAICIVSSYSTVVASYFHCFTGRHNPANFRNMLLLPQATASPSTGSQVFVRVCLCVFVYVCVQVCDCVCAHTFWFYLV